jgi:molybdopterin biosynthesis enzyme
VPVKVEKDTVYSVFKESGAITSTANAQGYIVLPENTEVLLSGSEVTVTFF